MFTDLASMRTVTFRNLMLTCVCNHPENAHSMSGRCRVPGCPCEHYQPMPEVAPPQSARSV
jgi:hypothetical protein